MQRLDHVHANMRVVVENTFGRVKGKWSVLRIIRAHPQLASAI